MRHGIAGLLRLDGSVGDARDARHVRAMAEAIAHRGLASAAADAAPERGPHGAETLGALTIAAKRAHERLAVQVDGYLSNVPAERAHEVVAALYERHGDDFAAHLDGAFAIALWDARRQALVLVRDRVGVRPLFVTRPRPGLVLFGSEMKALLAHPECPREVDWLGTLARFALPLKSFAPQCAFSGIAPVAPGTVQIWDATRGEVATRTYWSLRFVDDEAAAADRRSDDDIIAGYGETLRTVVHDAFAGSAGAALFLSGGIDSIAIAALGRALAPATFTVLNQSTWGNGDAAVARAAAEHLGLVNHQVVMRRGAGALTPEHWKKIVWTAESARCRGQDYLKSQLARFAHLHAPGLDVLLHGEGSDELIGADTRNYADYTGEESYERYLVELRGKQREELQSFESLAVEEWFGGATVFRDAYLARTSGRDVPTHPMQRRAFYCLEGLAEIVLQREDRFGAVNGMEARAPFVDHRLLEFVARIPPRAYPTLYWRKHVLRHALRHELPDALRLQRKVGFYVGADGRFTSRMLVDLLTADGGALVREAFGDPEQHAVLAPGFIRELVDGVVSDPESTAIDGLLTLVNLGLLEGMAKDVAAQARLRELEEPTLQALETWDEAALPALFADVRVAIDPARPLALGAGVELARPVAQDDALWIVVNDAVRFVIDEPETRPWRDVLCAVDGNRSLGELLAACGTTLDAVRKYLDEALEFDVVNLG